MLICRGTATSGYLAKQLLAALQTEILDEPGTDCGTKETLEVVLQKGKRNDYLYRYIVDNGKLVLLDDTTFDKYVGKKVHMRSPMYCISDKLCSKCAGEQFYMQGKTNIGLVASKVATTCTNLNMKKFHENLIKMKQIDPDDMLI